MNLQLRRDLYAGNLRKRKSFGRFDRFIQPDRPCGPLNTLLILNGISAGVLSWTQLVLSTLCAAVLLLPVIPVTFQFGGSLIVKEPKRPGKRRRDEHKVRIRSKSQLRLLK